MTDADTRTGKLLKQHGNVQMSQETTDAPRGRQVVRYFVGLVGGPAKAFDTPHGAWAHFQQLTGEEGPGDLMLDDARLGGPVLPSIKKLQRRTRARLGSRKGVC